MTGLSYPASLAFPQGPRWSRFPLPSLTCFHALSSPPVQSRLRRSFPNAPWRGFAPLHVEQGLSALPQLPCPCRPTSKPHGLEWVEGGMSASSARYSRTNQVSPVCSYGGLLTLGERQRGVSPSVCVCSWRSAWCVLARLRRRTRQAA